MGDFVVVAVWQARPGAAGRLKNVLRQMVGPSRTEPGCLAYEAHRSTADEGTFMLYERYTDQEAYQAHLASPHFEELARDQGLPLLVSRVRTTYETFGAASGRHL